MKLCFMDTFVAEDSPMNCAIYTYCVLDVLKQKSDMEIKEKAKKEMELMEKLGNMTFEELFWKMEHEEDGEAGT